MHRNIYRRGLYERWLAQEQRDCTPIWQWLESEEKLLRKELRNIRAILDIGCGNGRELRSVLKSSQRAVCMDRLTSELHKARRNLRRFKNVEFRRADATRRVPYKSATFGAVILTANTFGNLGATKAKVLKEAFRVLMPHGKIILSVYRSSSNTLAQRLHSYQAAGIKIIKKRKGTLYIFEGTVTEQFTKPALKKLLKNAGFTHTMVRRLGPVGWAAIAHKQ